MSSAAHKLAIENGKVNRPPVRFLFVGSTTAAYFFGGHRNRLGRVRNPHRNIIIILFAFFVDFCCCWRLFVGGNRREGGGTGGPPPVMLSSTTFLCCNLAIEKHRQHRTMMDHSKVVWKVGC